MLNDCIIIIWSPLTVFLCFCISHFSDKLILWYKFSTDKRQTEDTGRGFKDHRGVLHLGGRGNWLMRAHQCQRTEGGWCDCSRASKRVSYMRWGHFFLEPSSTSPPWSPPRLVVWGSLGDSTSGRIIRTPGCVSAVGAALKRCHIASQTGGALQLGQRKRESTQHVAETKGQFGETALKVSSQVQCVIEPSLGPLLHPKAPTLCSKANLLTWSCS